MHISWNVQNQIMEACDEIMKRKTTQEIRDVKFFTILANESQHISTTKN